MKKNNIILVVVLILTTQVFAQQVALTNFYTKSPFIINPAAAGINENISGNLRFKDQWSQLKGAPEISSLGVHGLITNTMGLGVNVEQNVTGVLKQVLADVNYSYRLPLGEEKSLAFGLKFGFTQNSLDYDAMVAGDKSDPTLNTSSLVINEALIQTGFGMHFNMKDLNVHLATPLLYGQQERQYVQTLFALCTYDFFFSEDIWKVQPSLLYRYTKTSPGQVDLNVNAEWNKKLWSMVSYRTNNSFIGGFGFFLKNIGLGYSYDLNRSVLSNASAGGHEVIVNFESNFSLNKKEPHYKSSRSNLDAL